MRAQVTIQPGQKGAKLLLDQYGERLVGVRYRYDAARKRRIKTLALIVAESLWQPPPAALNPPAIVGVRGGLNEVDLQRRVILAGGK